MPNGEDRRQHERTALDLTIRFVTREDLETVGKMIDISEGGLAMLTETNAQIGDPVIAYPEGLGRLTGKVVRKFDSGVAVEFELSDAQRTHLRRRIQSAVSGVPYIRLLENRKHKRIELNLDSEAHNEASGEVFKCEIVDISETGSRIRSKARPQIGSMMRVGSLRGVVRRHTDDGFAIEFTQEDAEKAAAHNDATAPMQACA